MKELFRKWITNPAKELKPYRALVDVINTKEPEYEALPDSQLTERAVAWQAELAELLAEEGTAKQDLQDKLDELLPSVFAAVRTAAKRTLGERHYDVQLIGGMVIHQGRIAEMKTGEGKTLVSTLPIALNALLGKGVHVVTVNDYLARRDAEWMGPIYRLMGLSYGAIQNQQPHTLRHDLYRRHITYGTNSEFGFDYLRDNMVINRRERVQRPLYYGIVDEIDSILIDEARTPLIISGAGEQSTDLYRQIDALIPRLTEGIDYEKDEKERHVTLTEDGADRIELQLQNLGLLPIENLFDPANSIILHHVNQALRARVLYKRDVEYVVEGGEVIIVDEFTGRKMVGRRYSDGLHQAIEAKENVRVRNENQTLATITIQNYYRLYDKLAGMTGTAKTEEDEFTQIYGLTVQEVPTHMPMVREDQADLVYATRDGKYRAIVEDVAAGHHRGQPSLIGTVSVEVSELISSMLEQKGIPHNVLNAKNHEREAEIVATAGQQGAVTVATNMAGRGTDIKLGPGVRELGGLYIVGSERHESRRIDNQLRGRSGRQGDPGKSRFFLSLEDDLMRIFGSERIKSVMGRMGMTDEAPLEHNMLTKAVENAQKKVEGHNFEIRKHVLKYDDIMEKQRSVIYHERNRILEGEIITDMIEDMVKHTVLVRVDRFCIEGTKPPEWDLKGLLQSVQGVMPLPAQIDEEAIKIPRRERIGEILIEAGRSAYYRKTDEVLAAVQRRAELDTENPPPPEAFDPENRNNIMRQIERYWTLKMIDKHWIRHLYSLDSLRDGIGLKGYAQRDPLVEYTRESYVLFQAMRDSMRCDVLRSIFATHFTNPEQAAAPKEDAAPSYRIKSVSAPAEPTTGVRDALGPAAPPPPQRPALRGSQYRERASDATPAATTAVQPRPAPPPPPPKQVQHTVAAVIGRNDACWCGSGKKYKKCHAPEPPPDNWDPSNN